MKIRSVKFNFIMNFILTASAIVFPLITFPYVSRVLQAAGNGKVAFAASVLAYFSMFASLGIPTYGIRVCAKLREDKEKLSHIVQELLIINTVTMLITCGVYAVLIQCIPQFAAVKELMWINGIGLVLNVFGVSWLYSGLEQYAYITVCSLFFKVVSIIMMFAWVKKPEDYVKYGAITILAASGSYVINFINLHKFVSLKKTSRYNFRRHLKPICIFFATSAAISVYTNLDVVMLRFMKNDAEVGYYNAAIKVKIILVSLITSLGTVLLPRLSFYVRSREKEAFYGIILKAFNFVLILALSVTVYFMLLAKETILVLSGNGYQPAILPMILLMPTVLLIGLSNITGIQVLTPNNEEKKVMVSILFGAVLDFALNLALIPKQGASGAAFATVMAELVVLLAQCVFIRGMLKEMRGQLHIKKPAVAALISGVAVMLVKSLLTLSPFFMICVTGIIFFGLYFSLLLLVRDKFVMNIWASVLGKIRGFNRKG